MRHTSYLCFFMMKRFFEWIKLKKDLHERRRIPPYVREKEIWWARIGENIGHEMNGKNEQFSRPVLIFKKLSQSLFFAIPLTTQMKTGTWFVSYRQSSILAVACLHQARTIDYRRLSKKLGELDDSDFKRIKAAFFKLYR